MSCTPSILRSAYETVTLSPSVWSVAACATTSDEFGLFITQLLIRLSVPPVNRTRPSLVYVSVRIE